MTNKVTSVFKKGAAKKKRATHKKATPAKRGGRKTLSVIARGTATLGAPGCRKHKRRRHTSITRRRSTHLSGVADVLGMKNPLARKATDGLTTILLVGGGVVLGGLAGKGINKILKIDETTTGWKKYLKPGILTAVGTVGVIFLKKGETKEDVIQGIIRKLSTGIAIAGGISLIDTITGKSLLGNVGLSDEEVGKVRADYYKVAEETMRKINEAQNFKPVLKEKTDGPGDDEEVQQSQGNNGGEIF
jgi:hypothetical protein